MRALDGSIYYNCQVCRDLRFVHPVVEVVDENTGEVFKKPDYSKATLCRCRRRQKWTEIDTRKKERSL